MSDQISDAVVEIKDKNDHFSFVVKQSFLEKCPEPSKYDAGVLATQYKFYEFLHNPNGKALQCLIPGKEKTFVYVLDGKYINDPKIIESIVSKKQFNDTFDQLIK